MTIAFTADSIVVATQSGVHGPAWDGSNDSFKVGPYVLLVQRLREPFQNHWAFPGGFVGETEEVLDAAFRELAEETGVAVTHEDQLSALVACKPDRDPRGRIISFVHLFLLTHCLPCQGADDAKEARWFQVAELDGLELAFDHGEILSRLLAQLPMVFGLGVDDDEEPEERPVGQYL